MDAENATGKHPLERRNMLAGIVHGAFFNMAQAFAEPYALLPIFLAGFFSSKLLIGLIVGLTQATMVLPQLPVSRILRRRPHLEKPFMLTGIWTRCGVWGVLGAIAVFSSETSTLLLWASILLIGLYSFSGGIAVLPMNQMIHQTIRPERRSSFFGWRLFFGSFLAMAAGYLIKQVLGNSELVWPRNFGILFLFSFTTLIVAYSAMSCFKFPSGRDGVSSESMLPVWHECRQVLREYPVMKRLLAIQLVTHKLALFMPFLTLYATEGRHIPLKWVGIFIVCLKLGTMLSNLLWMPIGNRFGTRLLIRLGIAASILALSTCLVADNVIVFSVAFFITGFAYSALMIGYDGYILELGHAKIRVLLVAIRGTLLLPLYFMPLLGGWIADELGYFWLLIVGIIIFSIAFLLSLSLCEPRNDDSACGPVHSAGSIASD